MRFVDGIIWERQKKSKPMTETNQMSIQMQATDLKNTQNLTIPKNILIPGQKRGISRYKKAKLRKRSGVEAYISHMKNRGKLDRNYLKGIEGDIFNSLLCAIGRNMRYLLRHNLIFVFLLFLTWLRILHKKRLYIKRKMSLVFVSTHSKKFWSIEPINRIVQG